MGDVRLTANTASGNGGGVCALLRDENANCQSSMPFQLHAVSGGTMSLTDNAADSGGGALFANCISPGPAWTELASAPESAAAFSFSGNTAGYGNNVATMPVELGFDPFAPLNTTMRPGDQLKHRIRILDGFSQTVKRREGVLPYTVTVQTCVGNCQLPNVDILSTVIRTFESDGLIVVSPDNQPVTLTWPWDQSASSDSERVFVPSVEVSHFIGGALSGRVMPPLVRALNRSSCAPGTSYDITVQVCVACPVNRYVVNPDQHPCQTCPQGGICDDGSTVKPSVDNSVFVAVGAFMRITSCPQGYVLVRDDTEGVESLDQCVLCPEDSYSLETALYPDVLTVSNVEEATRSGLCIACPSGASCVDGNVEAEAGFFSYVVQERRAGALVSKVFPCPKDACTGGNRCAKGRTGPVCGQCASGYVLVGEQALPLSCFCPWCIDATCSSPFTRRMPGWWVSLKSACKGADNTSCVKRVAGDECQWCGDRVSNAAAWLTPIVVIVVLILWYGVSWHPYVAKLDDKEEKPDEQDESALKAKAKALATHVDRLAIRDNVKIILAFFQVSGTFVTVYNVPWPFLVDRTVRYTSGARFDLAVWPGTACLFTDFNYWDKLLFYTLVPIGGALMLGMPAALVMLTGGEKHEKYKPVMNRFWLTFMFW
eukprot:1161836-Rhodomonas_salina.1